MKGHAVPVSYFSAAERLLAEDKPASFSICILHDIKTPISEIKSRLSTLNCALINPQLLESFDQLCVAVMRVFAAYTKHALKTRTPHTELLFHLSPSTNVTESLRIFGLDESCTTAVAVRLFDDQPDILAANLAESIDCSIVAADEHALSAGGSTEHILQLYKIKNAAHITGEVCSLLASKGI